MFSPVITFPRLFAAASLLLGNLPLTEPNSSAHSLHKHPDGLPRSSPTSATRPRRGHPGRALRGLRASLSSLSAHQSAQYGPPQRQRGAPRSQDLRDPGRAPSEDPVEAPSSERKSTQGHRARPPTGRGGGEGEEHLLPAPCLTPCLWGSGCPCCTSAHAQGLSDEPRDRKSVV